MVERPRLFGFNLLTLAWLQAVVATLGSLYFSQVMGLLPCEFCWYQRIAMYPLVLIFTTGLIMRDPRVRSYALPLSLIGLLLAIYHNLLYYGVIPPEFETCRASSISCTVRQIEWFGVITIPLMSLVAFAVINLCLFLYQPQPVAGPAEQEA